MKIAVMGGTGPQGRGLAYRFALAGHEVIIGSRDADRARATAEEIAGKAVEATDRIDAAANVAAAGAAEAVLLAVPYKGHDELVASLAAELSGKIVMSCVNPLGFDSAGPYGLTVPAGSAAEEAQLAVPDARVVGAFHHVSAVRLWKHEGLLDDEDVLICGDDEEANQSVAELATAVTGRVGIIAGRLRLAHQLETLTGALISINKRYKTHSGVHITGVRR